MSASSLPSTAFHPIRRGRKRCRVYCPASGENKFELGTVFCARGHPDIIFFDNRQRAYITALQAGEYIE
ncbi:unnamed protein product, partial [Amoebophrya sp. A25]|eukprot:GSA25T00025351001.1